MPRLRIIRASTVFDTVIVVMSTWAGDKNRCAFNDPRARYFLFDGTATENTHQSCFQEINKKTAEGYFSGQADGLGYSQPLMQSFNSFQSCAHWIKKASLRAYRAYFRAHGLDAGQFQKQLALALEKWFGHKPGDGFVPSKEAFHEFAEAFFSGSLDEKEVPD